jgi:hypothetical protein
LRPNYRGPLVLLGIICLPMMFVAGVVTVQHQHHGARMLQAALQQQQMAHFTEFSKERPALK